MKRALKWLFDSVGLEVHLRRRDWPEDAVQPAPDRDPLITNVLTRVRPYTMTSDERIIALIDAVRYVVRNKIRGDFVECGVWRGGSVMTMALTLMAEGVSDRRLLIYDTFSGMSDPTEADVDFTGQAAKSVLERSPRTGDDVVWGVSGIEDVRRNIEAIGYPRANVSYVQGRVEDTIPQHAPREIALLRLDTDWYESTRHELVHLYPLLVENGVLIIDDYGHWRGARAATDQYFGSFDKAPYMHRIDYTGRLIIKQRI
jgi:O-methyltransferase